MHSKCLMTPMQYLSKVNLAAQCTQPGQSGEIISDIAYILDLHFHKILLNKSERFKHEKRKCQVSLNTFKIDYIMSINQCSLSKCHTRYVSGVVKYKKVFPPFDNVSHVYLMRGFQKYERTWIITMAFWVTCKIAQPIQPIWQHILPCLGLPSKSHHENSISSIF